MSISPQLMLAQKSFIPFWKVYNLGFFHILYNQVVSLPLQLNKRTFVGHIKYFQKDIYCLTELPISLELRGIQKIDIAFIKLSQG